MINPHSFRLTCDATPPTLWSRFVDLACRRSSDRVTVTPCRGDDDRKLEYTRHFAVAYALDEILDWLRAMGIPFGIGNDGVYVHPRTCEDTMAFIGRWVARL